METDVIVQSTPAPVDIETSMADLRAALRGEVAPPTETPATPVTETKPQDTETKQEAEPGTAEEKQEPEEVEPELPEGAKKRIQRIARDTARTQLAIDRALSEKKAAEEQLKKLTTGSEPATITEKPSDGRPVRPKQTDFNTMGEYWDAQAKYEGEFESWMLSEADKRAEQKWAAKQGQQEVVTARSEALKQHPDFPAMADAVVAASPEGLQLAISNIDNWAGVTVHLGKHPEELAALVSKFEQNPYAAVAELGRLEERLKPATKQAEVKPVKPLPPPLKPVAGTASASVPAVSQEAIENDMAALKRETKRVREMANK